ncbi:UNVERIFIED_CONTAM: hypothetical protein H355_014191, partial [Colinus virginianus]
KLGDGLFLQCCREVAAEYPEISFSSIIVDNATMQATRNTGKSIANKNVANPTAAMLAACMMLDHLRLHNHASNIRNAVLASLDDPRTHTPDMGGQGTTSGAVQSILSHLHRA